MNECNLAGHLFSHLGNAFSKGASIGWNEFHSQLHSGILPAVSCLSFLSINYLSLFPQKTNSITLAYSPGVHVLIIEQVPPGWLNEDYPLSTWNKRRWLEWNESARSNI